MAEPVCEGKRVLLREVRVADAARIAAFKRDPLVREMALGRSPAATEEEQAADIEAALASDGQLYCLIVLRDSLRPIGYVRINWMDGEHRAAWLRFALGEERGKGHARDALRAFLGHLFSEGAHRVEAETYEVNTASRRLLESLEVNTASRRLLESLGFVVEGRKREAHETEAGPVDVFVLGLLAREFSDAGGDGGEAT
jgi:RimJ/RimL family protein N-acetyltransferase